MLRRFVPRLRDIPVATRHTVHAGDRVDVLAAHYLGDAELHWRIADANGASDMLQVTATPGRAHRDSASAGIRGRLRRYAMIGGIKLSLLMGPVPIPAPRLRVEALSAAKVDLGSGETQGGFELTFDLPAAIAAAHAVSHHRRGGGVPLMRVVLIVTINGRAEPIVDGVATDVEVQPGEGGIGKLIVKGKDLSALMDIAESAGVPFPAMPPSVRVLVILAKYAAFGVIPLVIPSVVDDPPLPLEQIPQQQGTDYAYIKKLAQDAGYVFYLEPGPVPGTSKAYWGPEIRVGQPQPALTTGMDALTNVEQLSFNFDREAKSIPVVYFQDQQSKQSIGIPIPDVTPMNPPLGLIPPLPPKVVHLSETGHLKPPPALMKGLAYVGQNSDAVFGTGHARRRPVRTAAQVPSARRRARRGTALRRPVLRA